MDHTPPAHGLLTPSSVTSLLAEYGLRPSRALGQHFLADPNTARRIVGAAGIDAGDAVLEIGPGLGSLSLALCDAGAHVVALEKDRHLIAPLRQVVGERVAIVQGDAMSVDFAGLIEEAFGPASGSGSAGVHSVSNLPYNVATPVVVRLLEEANRVHRLLVMVQHEVARRLVAGPGSKEYGAVSVKVAYYANAELVGDVPPTVFIPKPAVDSALVRIVRHTRPPVDVKDPDAMFSIVRAGFAQRRKMLRRALVGVLGADAGEIVAAAGLDPRARAETLGLQEWAALSRVAGNR